jgi:[glutamine synthetase] adenylyltransferase / [glutamine synthetase]-adenylyl-L-tyrosine phosphorylase
MAQAERWIREKAEVSLHPSQVETTLARLSQSWPPAADPLFEVFEHFPLGEAALLNLLSLSSICASRLIQDPQILLWLRQPEVCLAHRDRVQMSHDLHGTASGALAARNFRALRVWKGREMVRIALREIADVAPLEETTGELSQIAEICIRRVFDYWNKELRQRYGSPDAEFVILALGKLGGNELNHSSDVDLVFLYSHEGQLSSRLSHHEFFNRLGKQILETFSRRDSAGSLFRVDLRLRPEGTAGPLARSLESMENYYGGFGETWERLALIKARGIAGSQELAYEFLRQHQPFIYPKSPTPDLLEEIANIKRRIERDVVGSDNLQRDIKLGRGGIREIEFVVQTLQFIHGARQTFLQEPSTLKALRGLAQLELVPHSEIRDLDRAYRFLRSTEHRLQIEAEQQIHTLPQKPEELRRLAVSLGFPSTETFMAALEQHMLAVRSVFRRIIAEAPAEKAAEAFTLEIFTDRSHAERAMVDLAQGPSGTHVSPRTRQVFRKLRPLLLQRLAETADPDATLNQLVRFVQAYGMRSLLFELLVTNPKLLELLVKTFDASRFAGDLLVRHPQLLEDITRDPRLNRAVDSNEHLQRLRSIGQKAASLDTARAYRQRQLLRIILRDLLGLTDGSILYQEQSDLAEACLIFVNEILGGDQLTIIAMGKFGGREITYGADLDVLFVGNESRAGQKLLAALAQPSAEGSLSRVDARLRPEGEKGPLVCSVQTYETYYNHRAQPWELQALTRARPITGPLQKQFTEVAQSAWAKCGLEPQLYQSIDHMLDRIRRERGSGSDFFDLKTGAGGIIEAEFLVQAMQMRAQLWEPNWTRAVDVLRQKGNLSQPDVDRLENAYAFLRRCESVLRRYEHRSVSALPVDLKEQFRFCRRLGLKDVEKFPREYEAARVAIHAMYDRIIKGRGPTISDGKSSDYAAL